ncbi:MAG TPA: 16S rRNA (adenine(1518)-N(6)/adenine(1519)-N(6))-dimethyltransferase RsmA [Candidatus Margulisiibacteriota bacterium]|nr:16S rRNA (adenine(1518)-N(6)/adenine(1519)-N(6))-dimethyltransferase RsmA [Candidatus Margulisiibacteriota bacterium]
MSVSRAGRRPAGAVRRELATMGRHPRKRLGQHFLADKGVAQRIVDLAQLRGTERVVEIGPGLGALTELLIQRAGELWLIEVDADLAARLRARYADRSNVHVVEGDVLRLNLANGLGTGAPAVVVANLPYNIATAILAALLDAHCFTRLVLMLQREVVDRLRAQPGSKDYGALSVYTQFAAQLRPGLRVGPEAFVPRPKVESEVVVVEPYAQPPVAVDDPALFNRVVRAAFNQRRKQLANSLRAVCTDPATPLHAAHIDPTRRPETLTLAEFAALSNAVQRQQTTEGRTTDIRHQTGHEATNA